jgi:hypothetical protein
MYYQLPNGKTVWVDVSDAINMTDQDIQALLAGNYGEVIQNPFRRSVINYREPKEETNEEELEEEEERDLDDDPSFYYHEFYPDEFPDVEDPDINFDNLEE